MKSLETSAESGTTSGTTSGTVSETTSGTVSETTSTISNDIITEDDIKNQRIAGYVLLVLSLGFFIYSVVAIKLINNNDDKDNTFLLLLATLCLSSLTVFILSLSWIILVNDSKDKLIGEKITPGKFFDAEKLDGNSVFIGVLQGFIFGTIDNFGMGLGLSAIEELLKKRKMSNIVSAGMGNLYSSVFGSVMGASFQKAMERKNPEANPPWWGNLIGIIVGSCLGIFLAGLISGKSNNKSASGA